MKDKIFTLKASLDPKIFRVIEIKGSDSLYNLAEAILNTFDFDMDHAFGFFDNLKNLYDSRVKYEIFSGGGTKVKKTIISEVFSVHKKMAFLFDYGDEWVFTVESKGVSDPVAKVKYPRQIESVGEAPEQYPEYDEDEEVDEDECISSDTNETGSWEGN